MTRKPVSPRDVLELLAELRPSDPDFEKAVSAFVTIAMDVGWSRQAINRELERYDVAIVKAA